ncbi:hypothetical protein OUZ56_029322 [Daphnia magna]|uniref:Uncharacterized protein n=1 Tax=Daphnia magna TaxID=35525 RepID=A0ABR0B6G9_9CRUS|nr:hypothetical protein OUZ56_029322 [Daphnia magna]
MGAPSRRCEGSVRPCASVGEPVVRKVVDHGMLTSYLWVKIYLTWLKFDKGTCFNPMELTGCLGVLDTLQLVLPS